MNNDLLEEYKKLPDIIKNNLDVLLSYKACYERDEKISDDMVLFISSLAHNCWLEDEYSQASEDYYANYLLNAVYDYNATKNQLKELDYSDIVEAYNTDRDVVEILKFKTENYEYCFTTVDNEKYYSDDDGFYVVNDKGIKIKESHPMADAVDDLFDLLKDNKIKYMPLSMHYNIRCIIKNDILGDKESEERYRSGINNYKNYCEERFITSKDILNSVKLENDIDLFDLDSNYSDERKLSRLKNILENGKNTNIYNYSYVGSITNGNDYYFNNISKMYLAIDKNNIIKYFDDEPLFILKELKKKDKFSYISERESKKIADSFTKYYMENGINKNWLNGDNFYAINQYLKYENDKELNSFDNKNVVLSLTLAVSMKQKENDSIKKDIGASRNFKEQQKNRNEKDL